MKRKTISRFVLASASTILLQPALSEDVSKKPIEPIVKEQAKLVQNYHMAVDLQVLQYINPQVPLIERFSRVKRPMPKEHYASEIVKQGEDGIVEFRIVHINRLLQAVDPEKHGPTFVVAGRFNSATGAVLLMDTTSEKYIPSAQHPLILKSQNDLRFP